MPVDGSYSIEAARFTPDRSTAFLSLCPPSGDKAQCDLYSSQFSVVAGQFTTFTKMTGVSTPNQYDAYPTLTPDGKTMLFGSTRSGNVAVYVATAKNGSFDSPTITRIDVAGTNYGNEPYVLRDGRTVFLSAGSNVTSRSNLYRIEGTPPWAGTSAVPVPGVSSPTDNDFAPVVSDDELEIFFASNRLTPAQDLALDIFTARRAAKSELVLRPRQGRRTEHRGDRLAAVAFARRVRPLLHQQGRQSREDVRLEALTHEGSVTPRARRPSGSARDARARPR